MLLFIIFKAVVHMIFSKFQNIVCYCLSDICGLFNTYPAAFQNIVCYCLSSSCPIFPHSRDISKHRMLLFISNTINKKTIRQNFKTSYVTVYRLYLPDPYPADRISKHRMLLFIKEPDSTPDKNPGFQNIVCYCLSLPVTPWLLICTSFQNIVCYCLSTTFVGAYVVETKFQNIVCYCLS